MFTGFQHINDITNLPKMPGHVSSNTRACPLTGVPDPTDAEPLGFCRRFLGKATRSDFLLCPIVPKAR
jgi:hypothetical protein